MSNSRENPRPRVLSGMRPTGKLHLGNYVGALKNWVELQETHDCFFMVADWHALTTDYDNTSRFANNTLEVVVDFLAAGLDPEKCTIFVQSHVLQHAELHVLFSMITPLGWLERVPSYKDQQIQMPNKDLHMYGFLGYPLLQAADILVYRADFVPVGEDQVAHVELTREVARRFNSLYPLGKKRSIDKEAAKLTEEERQYCIDSGWDPKTGQVSLQIVDDHPKYGRPHVFPEPESLLTPSPKLLGTDKRKMSKSYGNTILLSDDATKVAEKIKSSVTDRPKLADHGSPDRCPVGNLHQIFSNRERLAYITQGCTNASITCVECKSLATPSVNAHLEPIRERRHKLAEDEAGLKEIIQYGAQKAAKAAEETMSAVREAVGILTLVSMERTPKESIPTRYPFLIQGVPQDAEFVPLRVPEIISGAKTDDELKRIRIDTWLERVSKVYPLREDRLQIFITRRGRKVGVDAAIGHNGMWSFRLQDRPLNVLVLIAEDNDRILHDYVLPPKVLQEHWKKFQRNGDSVEIKLKKTTDGASLALPEGDLPIQQYQGDHSALQ
jgi:tryptophanyl-tRNA synthetase